MRHVLALLFLASPLYAQTITLPKTVEVKTNRLAAVVVKSDCKSIVYDLIADGQADVFREASDDGSIHLRVLPYQDGKYYLYVSGALGDKVVSAKCTITSSGGAPAPAPVPTEELSTADLQTLSDSITLLESWKAEGEYGKAFYGAGASLRLLCKKLKLKLPTPAPPPVPVQKAVSLTFVVLTPTQKTVLVTEDASLRQFVSQNNIGVYGIKTQAELDGNPHFKGIVPPTLVLQDASNAVIASLDISSGDAAAAKAFVSKYTGK